MKRRFQVYMRLVDISFWITAIFLARLVARFFGHPLFVPGERGGAILLVAVFCNLALAVFIVLARFMRDEHAERIWQLTARRFVNALVASCALVAVVLPIIEERFTQYVKSRDWTLPTEFYVTGLNASQTLVKYLVGGFGMAVMIFGLFAPLIFVVLYKWALWRDSQ